MHVPPTISLQSRAEMRSSAQTSQAPKQRGCLYGLRRFVGNSADHTDQRATFISATCAVAPRLKHRQHSSDQRMAHDVGFTQANHRDFRHAFEPVRNIAEA